VDALHALWTEPEVRRYLWDDVTISRDTAAKIVESHLSTMDRCGIGFWALHVPPVESAEPLAGFCGFRLIDDGPDIELMYGIRRLHWGKGLATEACGAALENLWRSTSFSTVYARTDPPNSRSVQVMQRLGMKHESTTASMVVYVLPRPHE
jgi:ribosomal-protein-alanine N-acetyltransferase